MAFAKSEIPKEIQDEADLYADAKDKAMGLASFLGSFMLPGSMGLTYPKNVQKLIPVSTQIEAQLGRRLLYRNLKNGIQDIIENPKQNERWYERTGLVKSKAVERGLKDYKEQIKAITATPDAIMARIKTFGQPNDNAYGWWSERLTSKPWIDKGGEMNIATHTGEEAATVGHEGLHAAHGVALKLYEKARTDPKAYKIWETIPKESQDVIKDLTRIEKFHQKWYTYAGRRGREKYDAFYDVWPAEQLAREGPQVVMGLASKLGRRLTMDEYLQALKPISSRLQKDVTVLNNQFKKLDSEMMKKVGIEFK